MNRIRKYFVGLGAAVATVLMLSLGAAPAHAVSGYDLDGTNPTTAAGGYCANGSIAIASYPIKVGGNGATVGTMEVRYSPSCGTNWVRVNNTIGGGYQGWKAIYRDGGLFPNHDYEVDPGVGWSYGMQLYAPGSTCIRVEGAILYPNSVVYAWTPQYTLC